MATTTPITDKSAVRVQIAIPTRTPLAAAELVGFLAHRVITAVESGVEAEGRVAYARSVRLAHGDAVVVLDADGVDRLAADVVITDPRDLDDLTARLRRLCDADVDPVAVDGVLGSVPELAPLVTARPGLRVPGAVAADELAFRALIGQQVSLAGAAATAGKITATYGSGVSARHPRAPSVTCLFPTAAQLAGADPETLPMPRARARALVGLAGALTERRVDLSAGADPVRARAELLALPGIGPWTADYVLLRGLGDPDILLDTDLAVRRELDRLGRPDPGRWAPWRSYATLHLWHGYLAGR